MVLIVRSERDTDDYPPLKLYNLYHFQNQAMMFAFLEERIQALNRQTLDGGLFTTFYRREKALKDVRKDSASFVWIHLRKVILMRMPRESEEAKREMIHECKAYYRNDAVQLTKINEFKNNYLSSDSIHWYTKPGFLSYLVNKALRSQDISALYKFRYFIIDLCHSLEEASRLQSYLNIRLYRGAKLNQEELEQLQVGCLVSTNGFFSCSTNRTVAEMFIIADSVNNESSKQNDDTCQQLVLFIIDVDRNLSEKTILANISQQSAIPDENEILFDFGSTFIVNEIVFDKNKCIWLIKISSTSDTSRITDKYEAYTLIRLQYISPAVLFGQSLIDIDSDFRQAIVYFNCLLKKLPTNHIERSTIYYQLGRIFRFIEQFDKAFYYFRCALLLIRRLLPERTFDYCRILAGIGSIYAYSGDSKRGIELIKRTLMIEKKSFLEDHADIVFQLNRLGLAYIKLNKYDSAISILDDAETFFLTKMPYNHSGYGQTLYLKGFVFRNLGEDEKALMLFQQALHRQYSLLANDHPDLASTYYQLSLLYKDRGDYQRALDCVQKAFNIQSIKLPHTHSQVKLSQELLRYLQCHEKIIAS